MVLVLSTLHQLLAQLLALPELHTAILLTPEGQLISVASDISRSKDQARIVAGVSGEVCGRKHENKATGMVESELGRIVVLPVVKDQDPEADALDPLLLLALNSTNSVEWENLLAKGKTLVDHIAPSMDKFRRDHSQAARSPTVVISSDRPSR